MSVFNLLTAGSFPGGQVERRSQCDVTHSVGF